jgi:hypothetical protein
MALGNRSWYGTAPYSYTDGQSGTTTVCGLGGNCSTSNFTNLCTPTGCSPVGAPQLENYSLAGHGSWGIGIAHPSNGKGSTYVLVIQFQGETQAETYCTGGPYSGARAVATINAATGGNGFWIDSIEEI